MGSNSVSIMPKNLFSFTKNIQIDIVFKRSFNTVHHVEHTEVLESLLSRINQKKLGEAIHIAIDL